LALGAALVAAAVASRGSAGMLMGFAALVLILDATVPMPGRTWSEADDRFQRLVRGRRRAERRRRLRGLAPERLDVLDDRVDRADRRALGVQAIALESVTGTAEALRATTFDRCFRPERGAAERWKRLWMAQAHGVSLPPVSVYRVCGRHVVRDGHHRVSVALDRGLTTIDAEVVELHGI
jgi:hypothetical protein